MSSTLCMSLLVYESAIMSAQRCSRCLLTSSAVQRQRSSVSVSASCECDVEMQLLLLFASVPFLSMCVGQSRLWPMGFARCALAGTFIGGSVCSRGRPHARPRLGGGGDVATTGFTPPSPGSTLPYEDVHPLHLLSQDAPLCCVWARVAKLVREVG